MCPRAVDEEMPPSRAHATTLESNLTHLTESEPMSEEVPPFLQISGVGTLMWREICDQVDAYKKSSFPHSTSFSTCSGVPKIAKGHTFGFAI